jgi:hypothetical protein
MVEGEAIMPIPGGNITTSQIWSEAPAEEVEVVEETVDESDDTEQA